MGLAVSLTIVFLLVVLVIILVVLIIYNRKRIKELLQELTRKRKARIERRKGVDKTKKPVLPE